LNDERTGEGGKNESAREGHGELEGTSRIESKEEGRREREEFAILTSDKSTNQANIANKLGH